MATEPHIVAMQGPIAASGGSELLSDITLNIPFGARIGIVGPNAAARSAVLRGLAGIDDEFTGEMRRAEDVSIGLLTGEPALDDDKDVRTTILEGVAEIKALLERFDTVNREIASPLHIDEVQELSAEQTRLYKRINAAGAWELERKLIDASNALRCPSGRGAVSTISAGDRGRVALCRLISSSPDLLLLDDPTAHLDADSIAWLESLLAVYPGTVVVATHDRMLLDGVADRILDIAGGSAVLFEGGYSAWSDDRLEKSGGRESGESMHRALARERQWVGASPAARQAARYLRVADYAGRLKDASGPPAPERLCVPPGPPLDAPPIETDGVVKGRGERLHIDALTFQVPAGAIIGVIGPEGAGKSTLLGLLSGQEEPDAGTVHSSDAVVLGVLGAGLDSTDAKKTVWDTVGDGHETVAWNGQTVPMPDYLAEFGFVGADLHKPFGSLTADGRYRARLAKILRTGVNLLLLDEPECDLDLDTQRILESALEDFVGSVVMVSHDRWLLDRIATHILAFAGDSQVTVFEGGYQDYRLDRRRRQGTAADRPQRLRYKRTGA